MDSVLIIVIVIACVFAICLVAYLGSSKLKSYFSMRTQEDWRRHWRLTHTNSMRGNLVRVFNQDINNTYYMDAEKQLGKGGCGVVVTGYQRDSGQEFAIKIVVKQSSERGRLDREIKLLKDVDHANIVRLFEVYDSPSHVYFVMELCTGGHLGELLARQQPHKSLDEEWGKRIICQLVSAVAHLHSRGICHRDIKLQNILMEHSMNKSAQIKLIDFGYGSRFIGALPMRTKCGTPYTTAPEVLRECYDQRCDVWSVGVVSFIVLSGKRPFEILDVPGQLAEAGKAAMMTNILMGRFSYNPTYWSRVSPQAVEFVDLLLHHDYKTRVHAHEALEHPWLVPKVQEIETVKSLRGSQAKKVISNMRRNSSASALRKTGLVALVFGLSPDRSINIRSLFQSIDTDNSGSLSTAEFKQAINVLAPELSDSDIMTLFDAIDIDGNKLISFTEFLAATIDPREIDLDDLNKAFKLLDADGNGYIEVNELETVLRTRVKPETVPGAKPPAGGALSFLLPPGGSAKRDSSDDVEAKIQDILQKCDLNGDGMISYDEFLAAMIDNVNEKNTKCYRSEGSDDGFDDEGEDLSEHIPAKLNIKRMQGQSVSSGASDSLNPSFVVSNAPSNSQMSFTDVNSLRPSSVQSAAGRPTSVQYIQGRPPSHGNRSSVYIDDGICSAAQPLPPIDSGQYETTATQQIVKDPVGTPLARQRSASELRTSPEKDAEQREGTPESPSRRMALGEEAPSTRIVRKKSSVRDMSAEDENFGQFGNKQLNQVQLSRHNLAMSNRLSSSAGMTQNGIDGFVECRTQSPRNPSKSDNIAIFSDDHDLLPGTAYGRRAASSSDNDMTSKKSDEMESPYLTSRAEVVSPADHSGRSQRSAGIPPTLAQFGKKLSGGFRVDKNSSQNNSSLVENYSQSNYSQMDTTMGSKVINYTAGDIYNDVSCGNLDDNQQYVAGGTSPPGVSSLFKTNSISKMIGNLSTKAVSNSNLVSNGSTKK